VLTTPPHKKLFMKPQGKKEVAKILQELWSHGGGGKVCLGYVTVL